MTSQVLISWVAVNELGVYGALETFLVDAEGFIRYKRVGDVNPAIWRDELQPALRALAAGAPATR